MGQNNMRQMEKGGTDEMIDRWSGEAYEQEGHHRKQIFLGVVGGG